MNVISKTFGSETAHIVRGASSTRCRYNIHGHSYVWKVSVKSRALNGAGMVMDFKDMGKIGNFIDQFDHSTVFWSQENSNILSFFLKHFKRIIVMQQNPTAENMARLVFQFCKQNLPPSVEIHKVEVWETAKGCAEATESNITDSINFISVEE